MQSSIQTDLGQLYEKIAALPTLEIGDLRQKIFALRALYPSCTVEGPELGPADDTFVVVVSDGVKTLESLHNLPAWYSNEW